METLGVGGLDKEIEVLYHAIKHDGSRGILLYGPPGTGKTTLARKLGKVLGIEKCNVKKIHPSDFSHSSCLKTELNVKKLFKESRSKIAESETTPSLQLLIIDQIDTQFQMPIYPKTQFNSEQTLYSAINNLLTNYKNLIIIGITTDKKKITPLLLKGGLLDVQIEIGLPDIEAREKIIKIHTRTASEFDYLSENVNFNALAAVTEGFSGNELKCMVNRATLFALNRLLKLKTPIAEYKAHPEGKIMMKDFEKAYADLNEEKN